MKRDISLLRMIWINLSNRKGLFYRVLLPNTLFASFSHVLTSYINYLSYPPPSFLRLPARPSPSNGLRIRPGSFWLAHAVQLERKARCTLTVGGLCDASMFTAKASILP
jgi:hypothetical protein